MVRLIHTHHANRHRLGRCLSHFRKKWAIDKRRWSSIIDVCLQEPLSSMPLLMFLWQILPLVLSYLPETGKYLNVGQKRLRPIASFASRPLDECLGPVSDVCVLQSAVDLFKCTLSDGRTVISMYDPESPAIILPTSEWMDKRTSDTFLAYGRAYEDQRPFFEQWNDFSRRIPRPAIIQDPKNESSEWSSYCMTCKNNYQCYCNSECRDLFYGDYNSCCSYSADLFGGDRVEWCYDGMRIDTSSHVFWSEWSIDCVSSSFLLNCRNCHDCFGCANLVNKSYCFLNEQLTSEEYRRRLSTIDLGDADMVELWRTRIMDEIWNRAYQCCLKPRS